MDRDSMKRLRLDRRLIRRRGWLSAEELAKELEGLPDVSDKIAPSEEPADAEASPPPEPPAQ